MRNYFDGSYGLDRYSRVILIIGVLFLINRSFRAVGILLIGYGIWRALSHNLEARRREERGFEELLRKINYKLNSFFNKRGVSNFNLKKKLKELRDRRYYVIIKCPKCSQKLRLPKKKGNIIVTCKKCFNEFRIKT